MEENNGYIYNFNVSDVHANVFCFERFIRCEREQKRNNRMKEKKFATLEELREQAIDDGFSEYGLEWLNRQFVFEKVIKNIPHNWLLWCLSKGYFQFTEFCQWDKLDGDDWVSLLNARPQFSEHCNWDKLNGNNWTSLLYFYPEFANFCKFNKLSGPNLAKLLIAQP